MTRAKPTKPQYELYMLGNTGAGMWTFCERFARGPGPRPDAAQHRRIHESINTIPAINVHNPPGNSTNPFQRHTRATKLCVWNSVTRRYDYRPATLPHVDAIIALYDVTCDESLKVAVNGLCAVKEELERIQRRMPLFLVANKTDLLVPDVLQNNRQVNANANPKASGEERGQRRHTHTSALSSIGPAANNEQQGDNGSSDHHEQRKRDEHAQHVRQTTDTAQRGGDHHLDECAEFFASVGAMREYEAGASAAASVGAEFGHSSSGPTPEVEALLRRVVAAVQQRECPASSSALGGLRLPLRPPLLT